MPFDSVNFKVDADVIVEPWQKVLLDAADYIEKHGWCQFALRDSDGRACALGAMIEVSPSDDDTSQAHLTLSKYVGELTANWNNREGRTASEVIQALRNCAKSS